MKKREAARFEDFGLEKQAEFFEREAERLGYAPPVIDTNDLLADPKTILLKLCRALGITWDPAMLGRAPGRRETDGIWSAHWYKAVEQSTSFNSPETRPVELPPSAERLAERCRPHYERLARHRITAEA